MQVIQACVPSARLSSAMCKAFKAFKIDARASAKPLINGSPAEILRCPIEPAIKHGLWFEIQDSTSVQQFLEATFLNVDFVMSLMPHAHSEDDRLALECLVTAASARKVTLAFQAKTTPSKLARTAKSVGNKPTNRVIAEQLLAVPNLSDLLVGYVDDLIASPRLLQQ